MLDISRYPRWAHVVEGVGEDPQLASKIALAASHPSREAVKAGAGSVMNVALNGDRPAWLLNGVLRDTWGFDGALVSDANRSQAS